MHSFIPFVPFFYSLGALYEDNTSGTFKDDDMVPPGGEYMYNWSLPIKFGIEDDDDNCVPWAYHSHVNAKLDVESGLVGLITACRQGIAYHFIQTTLMHLFTAIQASLPPT